MCCKTAADSEADNEDLTWWHVGKLVCLYVCVCVCVRACVRALLCVCVCVYVCA